MYAGCALMYNQRPTYLSWGQLEVAIGYFSDA